MATIIERTRSRPQPTAPAPTIREACLVGTPARRYRHIDRKRDDPDGPGPHPGRPRVREFGTG